jgi:hypothetical protein
MERPVNLSLAVILFLALVALSPAHAVTYNLSAGNSSLTVTSDNSTGASGWLVDGLNQLHQQQWWYGPSAAGQSSIDTLTLSSSGSIPSYAFFTYSDPGGEFTLSTTYLLQGGQAGSGVSNLTEQASVNNLTNSPLTFRLYLYTDLDLNGTPGGDTALITGNHHVDQWEGAQVLAQTAIGPDANRTEVNIWPNTLNSLTSGAAYSLNNVNGPLGPNNVTWAVEWDVVIPSRGSFQLSLVNNITAVPIPSAVLLLGAGLLRLVGSACRRRAV